MPTAPSHLDYPKHNKLYTQMVCIIHYAWDNLDARVWSVPIVDRDHFVYDLYYQNQCPANVRIGFSQMLCSFYAYYSKALVLWL